MLPDSGTVRTRGRVAGLIEVGAGFHPDLSGRDNVYLNGAILGMTEQQVNDRFDDIVEFSEIGQFIDTEVKFYSSGMYLRLAFSVAVHTDPEVFLIDEILAVGDEPFQRKCIDKIQELARNGKTLVVVSHDLDLVSRICARGILLEHGNVLFDGPIHDAVAMLRSWTGEPVVVRAAVKPVATLRKPLDSVDLATGQSGRAHIERSDVAILPRAAIVGEAMVALVLADALMTTFGGDTIGDLHAAVRRRRARSVGPRGRSGAGEQEIRPENAAAEATPREPVSPGTDA